jgi:micrococcal nuclease
MRYSLTIAILLQMAAGLTRGATPRYEITGEVVKIADGDTLTILDGSNAQHKIRLAGIDAPEKAQAFGTKARETLAAKVFRRNVRVDVTDVDRYHREVGRIYLGSRFVNLEMVQDGFAWRYVQYDRAGEFAAAEADARAHHRGLWVDPDAMPPWDFRRERRAARRTTSPLH